MDGSLVVSALALLLGVVNAGLGVIRQQRQRNAAVTSDLLPVLSDLRSAAWQFAKPLGGERPADLIAVHDAVIGLADLHPAINDEKLRGQVKALVLHPASEIALGIDPPRFMGLSGANLAEFSDLAQMANTTIERCQQLRRRGS
jgi:hypothetical protein